MTDDSELLRRYAQDHDEISFAEIVRRHIDFVYGAALRQCRGDAALAQDVTQLVFTDLARRALRLADHPVLLGWLHTATRFAAMKFLRTEIRRRAREQEAIARGHALPALEAPVDWVQLQPVLDAAIGGLRERDRTAILLRFFEGKSLIEVGTTLRVSETAARSCVDRALERLRDELARHGVTSTSTALSLVLANQVAAAAPSGLAASVAGTAVMGGAGGATLVPLIAMKKLILALAGLALAAEFATATVELKTKRSLDSESLVRKAMASAPPAPTEPVVNRAARVGPLGPGPDDRAGDGAELARLHRRLAVLKARPAGVVDAAMKTPVDVGRETPLAAAQTLTAALGNRDFDTLDRYVRFSDDTPENRASFMAAFSDAVRDRYKTPERLVMAFSFEEALRDPPVAQQPLETHGYSGGAEVVTVWTRFASGRETRDVLPFSKTQEGWALAPRPLTGKDNGIARIVPRINPVTGDILPNPR